MEVRRGKIDFYIEDRHVAVLDVNGFRPVGDFLDMLPLPDRLPLPTEEIAYLQLKEGDNFLIDTEMGDDGYRIFTRPNAPIPLVLPALAYGNPNPPSADVTFDVVVNPADWSLVSGRIEVDRSNAPVSLGDAIPLEIIRIAYEPVQGQYQPVVDLKIILPDILSAKESLRDLTLTNVVLSRDGLSGTAALGRYFANHQQNETYIAEETFDALTLKVNGVEATFGQRIEDIQIRMSGDIVTQLFQDDRGNRTPMHYTADVGRNRFVATMDVDENRIPMGFGTFEPAAVNRREPAITLSITDEEITLVLNGIFRMDQLGDDFALTVRNLTIGNQGVSADEMSILRMNDYQQFELFGISFEIKDVEGHPAISFLYENNIFYMVLCGELTFLDKKMAFNGLKIGTDGSITLDGVNFISRPLAIVDDYLYIDQMQLRQGQLQVAGLVNLPEPFVELGEQRFNFQINTNGEIQGGSDIYLINERNPRLDQDDSEFEFWIATLDVTMLRLKLDFANLGRSAVELMADLYIQNEQNKRILIGNRNNNQINPGLNIDFDGNVEWGNVAFERTPIANVDWDVLRLRLDRIGLLNEDDFGLTFSGLLSLNLGGVGGGLEFIDLGVNTSGEFVGLANCIRGGDLTITDLVTVSIHNIGYSDSPTNISINSSSSSNAGSEPQTTDEQIHVDSYFSFGANISIADLGQGGMDRFLVFSQGQNTSLIIENANFDVEDVVQFAIDLKYLNLNNGYCLMAGGRGQIRGGIEVMVAGKIAQIGNRSSFGLFVGADGMRIDIIPGIILLTGVGGGFFYNPEPADIQMVRRLCNLDNSIRGQVSDPGGFAILLYGAAAIVSDNILSGRALLTISERYFSLDAGVELFNPALGNRISGTSHLEIGFQSFYAEGNINLNVDVSPLIDANASIEAFFYGDDSWGIIGSMDVDILGFFTVNSDLFIGPPGFMFSCELNKGFDIYFLEVSAGFEGGMWFVSESWGAYFRGHIGAEVLGGVVFARGSMGFALKSNPFYLGGVASIEGCVDLWLKEVCWDGSVHASITSDGVSAGWGGNSEMSRLIRRAKELSAQLNEAQEQVQEDMEETQEALAAAERAAREAADAAAVMAARLSPEQLAKAGAYLITSWDETDKRWFVRHMEGASNRGGLSANERSTFNRVVDESFFDYPSKQSQLDNLANFRDEISDRSRELSRNVEIAMNRLNGLVDNLENMEEIDTGGEFDVLNSPFDIASFEQPVVESFVDANGFTHRRTIGELGFSVDEEMAAQLLSTIEDADAEYQEMETLLNEAASQISDRLGMIDEVIYRGNGNIADVAFSASRLIEDLGRYYAYFLQFDGYLKEYYQENKNTILGIRIDVIRAVQSKTGRIRNDTPKLFSIGEMRKDYMIYMANKLENENYPMASANEEVSHMMEDFHTREQYRSFSDQTGEEFWYQIGHNGNAALVSGMDSDQQALIEEFNEQYPVIIAQIQSLNEQIDYLYEAKGELNQNLYDIFDRLYYQSKRIVDTADRTRRVIDSQRGGQVGALTVNHELVGISRQLTNRNRLLRENVAAMLHVPQITELNVQSYSATKGGSAHIEASFQATHSFQYPEFSYQIDGDPSDPSGWINVGLRRNMEFYWLEDPDMQTRESTKRLRIRARGPSGFSNERTSDFHFEVRPLRTIGFYEDDLVDDTDMNIDRTPPSTPVVNYEGEFCSRPDILMAGWESHDNGSGIIEYQYRVTELVSTGRNKRNKLRIDPITEWISAMGATEATIRGLDLQHTHLYRIEVKARNGEDMWSQVGRSGRIRADLTPPTTPVWTRFNHSTAIAQQQNPVPASISGWWNASGDPQSGIREYQIAIKQEPSPSWNPNDYSVANGNLHFWHMGEPLVFMDTFYVHLVAINEAGGVSEVAISDPIKPNDITPPTPPHVHVPVYQPQTHYANVTIWNARDPETGIAGYKFAIGSRPGLEDLRPWVDGVDIRIPVQGTMRATNLALENGQWCYLSVKAVNGDDDESDVVVSNRFIVDRTPPPTASLSVTHPFPNILNIGFRNLLDPETPIVSSEYKIVEYIEPPIERPNIQPRRGKRPQQAPDEGETIIPWTALPGGINQATFTHMFEFEDPLFIGRQYKFKFRTRNATGRQSSIASVVFRVEDPSPPILDLVTLSNFTSDSTRLQIRIQAGDPETGIAEIQCRVRHIGGERMLDWVQVPVQQPAARLMVITNPTSIDQISNIEGFEENPLQHGQQYIIITKVRNGFGQWSQERDSEPIRILTRPPIPPVISEFQQTARHRLAGSWFHRDPGQVIREIQYAIGTTPEGTDVLDWTNPNGANIVYNGQLTVGESYYLTMKVRNALDQWSNVAVSQRVVAGYMDNTPPIITELRAAVVRLNGRKKLQATWYALDPQSGIKRYEIEVRGLNEHGKLDVLIPRRSVTRRTGLNGRQIPQTWSNLNFGIYSRFMVKLWATNRAGLTRTRLVFTDGRVH